MSIKIVKVKNNKLTAHSPAQQIWLGLFGFHEFVSIDPDSRIIQNIEYRYWRRHVYRYSLNDLVSGVINVDSNFSSVEPKSGVETQTFGLSLFLNFSKTGWIELCRFQCTRTIVPDHWVFFLGWLPFVKRDSIDDGMEVAKTTADYLTRHTGVEIHFPTYTTQTTYDHFQ